MEQGFAQHLEYRLVGMRQNSVTFQSSPNRVPNQAKEPLGGATTTKRKIEEQIKLDRIGDLGPKSTVT